MSTLAIDFDGVIHAYSKGWHDGTIYDPPLPGALEALHTLMETHAVYIHTTRDAAQVAPWLAERGFQVCTDADAGSPAFWNERGRLLVTCRKLPAVASVDDRAIPFSNWGQALADVQRYVS
jgi:hypothetical protein